MSENYMRELLGKTWKTPAQMTEKYRKEAKAFKARLASLPVEEAKAVCVRYLSLGGVTGTLSGIVATEYLMEQARRNSV